MNLLKSYFSSISRIFLTTLLGKLLGFIKIVLLIRLYGVSQVTDALIIVISIYWFWSNVIVYSLFSITLIPRLSKATSQKRQVFIALRTLYSVNTFAVIMFFLLILFNDSILFLFAPVNDDLFINNSTALLILMSPMLFLIPITEIFTILNQYNDRMITASLNLTIWNIFQIIAFIICFYLIIDMNYLIYIFAFLTVFGYVITSIVQLLKSNYFKFFRATSLVKLSLKNTILLVKKNYKFFASVIMLNLNLYVDNFFISSLANGNISKYNIIIKVPDVFQSLLVSSIAVVFFNIIAKDKNQAKSLFIKFSYFFAIVFLTGLAFVNIFGVEVLYLIYGVDAFAGLDELQIKKILLITTANVFFMVSIALLFKIFIINEKSNFIFISSSVNVLINIIANYLLINNYELLGIASSTLIANFVFYIILFFRINKFKQKINPKFKKL